MDNKSYKESLRLVKSLLIVTSLQKRKDQKALQKIKAFSVLLQLELERFIFGDN